MNQFISYVYTFVKSVFDSITTTIAEPSYETFLAKQIFGGTLINIGLTWRELFLYLITWLLVIGFIYLIYKIVFGVIKLICLR